MDSQLPTTGTAELLRELSAQIPDSFINDLVPPQRGRGRRRQFSPAQLWRVHLLSVLTPVHAFNLLVQMPQNNERGDASRCCPIAMTFRMFGCSISFASNWMSGACARSMNTCCKARMLRAVATGLMWVSATATAQTFNALESFGDLPHITGFPRSQLVQGADGALYGTTSEGAGNLCGTVFKVQPDGSGFTVLKCFTNAVEGALPLAGLTLSGSVLYGTTQFGGSDHHAPKM